MKSPEQAAAERAEVTRMLAEMRAWMASLPPDHNSWYWDRAVRFNKAVATANKILASQRQLIGKVREIHSVLGDFYADRR